MSYRNEGEQERADVERPRVGMMRLFGEMILLPFTVFVFGFELFARTIRELQRTTDQGMNLLAGETAPLSEDVPPGQSQSADSTLSGNRALPPSVTGGWGDLNSQTTTSTNDGTVGTAEVTDKERTMRDKDLNDDQLKLVRYKILFVKRDYETAFPEMEELVADNIDGNGFAAWKVAEFIQRLSDRGTRIPSDWIAGGRPKYPEDPRYTERTNEGWVLLGLPEKDKKYLRVYFEVLERYVREEDEDTDVDMLRDIRNQLKDGIKVYSSGAGTGGSAGGGPGYGGGGAGGGAGGGGYAGSGAGGGGQQGGGGYAGGGGSAGGGPGYAGGGQQGGGGYGGGGGQQGGGGYGGGAGQQSGGGYGGGAGQQGGSQPGGGQQSGGQQSGGGYGGGQGGGGQQGGGGYAGGGGGAGGGPGYNP